MEPKDLTPVPPPKIGPTIHDHSYSPATTAQPSTLPSDPPGVVLQLSFWIILERQLTRVSIQAGMSAVCDILRFKSSPEKNSIIRDSKYYKLKTPILADYKTPDKDIIQACMDARNWEDIGWRAPLKIVSETFDPHLVYLVVVFPPGEPLIIHGRNIT